MRKLTALLLAAVILGASLCCCMLKYSRQKTEYIRQAEFTVPYQALKKALMSEINSQRQKVPVNWIDILACLGAQYEGDFSRWKEKDMDGLLERLQKGESIRSVSDSLKNYSYYREVYETVLAGFVDCCSDQSKNATDIDDSLKVFFPIAKGFPYEHYDDFGAERTYGGKRLHLGHDIFCAEGTPVVAVEGGTVEAIGWNEYGGWRIGIRSKDKKRYYYYAHLRKDHPYQSGIRKGDCVIAGQVIGYVGRTGYSSVENTENIETPHLHFGLELIFDESQKESDNEIWIDLHAISTLLEHNKAEVRLSSTSNEFENAAPYSG